MQEWISSPIGIHPVDSGQWVLAAEAHEERDKWRNAVIDAAVVSWTYTKEDEENPYLAVCKLLACAAQEALDPQISLEAKRLHDRIAELGAEKDELQRRLDEVVKMLKPGEEPMRYVLGDQKVDHRPAARLYARALAIAEGRTP